MFDEIKKQHVTLLSAGMWRLMFLITSSVIYAES